MTLIRPLVVAIFLLALAAPGRAAADAIQIETPPNSTIDPNEIRSRIVDHPSTDSTGNPISVTAGPVGTWVPFTVGECWADGHTQQYVIPSPFPDPGSEFRPEGTGVGQLVAWQLFTPGGDPTVVHLQNQCDPNDFVPTPPPNPLQIWASTPLPTPSVLTSPRIKGLVGVANLFWYEGPTTLAVPPLTLGDWSVVTSAEISSINWYADGARIGSAEGSRLTGAEDEPAARGVFQTAGEVELRASVVWVGTSVVTYLPTGETFTSEIGTATRTETRTYVVEERQAAVNEGGPEGN